MKSGSCLLLMLCVFGSVRTVAAQPGPPLPGLAVATLAELDLDNRLMTIVISKPVYHTEMQTRTKTVKTEDGLDRAVQESFPVTVCQMVEEAQSLPLRLVNGAGEDLSPDALKALQPGQTILHCSAGDLGGLTNFLKPDVVIALSDPRVTSNEEVPSAPAPVIAVPTPVPNPVPAPVPAPAPPGEGPLSAPVPVPVPQVMPAPSPSGAPVACVPPQPSFYTYQDALNEIKSGRPERAQVMLDELRLAHLDDPLPCYVLAYLFHQQGRKPAAEQALHEGLSREVAKRIDWYRAMEPFQGPSRAWLESARKAMQANSPRPGNYGA